MVYGSVFGDFNQPLKSFVRKLNEYDALFVFKLLFYTSKRYCFVKKLKFLFFEVVWKVERFWYLDIAFKMSSSFSVVCHSIFFGT